MRLPTISSLAYEFQQPFARARFPCFSLSVEALIYLCRVFVIDSSHSHSDPYISQAYLPYFRTIIFGLGIIQNPDPFDGTTKSHLALSFVPSGNSTESASANDSSERLIHSTITPHQCYILLHSSQPISEFPASWSTPIQRALQLRVSRWGGLVNFSWYGLPLVTVGASGEDGEDVSIRTKKQPATAFTAAGGRLEIPDITLENLDQVEQQLKDHLNGPLLKETSDEIHLYVCTHGARDCRCGTKGSSLVDALREEKANYQRLYPESLARRIKIGQVSHVGGHQYAANLLMFPHGEWLGLLTAEDAPRVIHEVCKQEVRPRTLEWEPPLMHRNWRGRMGLSKVESTELWDLYIKATQSN